MMQRFFLRWKLWAIKRLLWRADAIICSLPTPPSASGDYYEAWGELGSVHSAVGALEHLRRSLYDEPSIFRASGPVDFDWGG